jgi:hypothetical protein
LFLRFNHDTSSTSSLASNSSELLSTARPLPGESPWIE